MTEVDVLLLGASGCGKTTLINSLRAGLSIHYDTDEGGEMDEVYNIYNNDTGNTYKVYVGGIDTSRSFQNIIYMTNDNLPILCTLVPSMYVYNIYPRDRLGSIYLAADVRRMELNEEYPERNFLDVRGDVADRMDARRMWNEIEAFVG